MTVREAIEQLVNLGEKDPQEIATRLLDRNGEDWVRAALDVRQIVADEARYVLGLRRRQGEARAQAHADVAEQVREVRFASVWIDGKGHVPEVDLTAADCLVRAGHHRKLAVWNEQKAEQYESWAVAIESAGVGCLGDLLSAASVQAAA